MDQSLQNNLQMRGSFDSLNSLPIMSNHVYSDIKWRFWKWSPQNTYLVSNNEYGDLMDSFKDNLYPSDSHVYTINELKYINRLFLNFIIYLLHSITLDNFPFWNFCLLSILLLMMISNLTVTWLFIQILFEVITFSRMAYDHYGKMSITLLADVGQFVSQIIHLIRKIPGRNWYSYICCLLYFSYNNEFYRFQFLLIHV